MNIALIGYGKMGKMIEAKARERGHCITVVVDPFAAEERTLSGAPVYRGIPEADFSGVEAAVEFTRPDTAPDNIKALAGRHIPVTAGTTGWLDRLEEVRKTVEDAGSSLLWASNFSLGVHLFYRIAAYAAKIADPFPEYDVGGWESHHNKKADSPSGTAKTLTERVLAQMKRKKRAVWDTLDRPPEADEIHYPSLRIGSMPGVHALLFDSPADTIEITHTARNREGFALGAIRAAEWLVREPGRRGVFTMDDVLDGLGGI
ncbi:MAG: 4-hydroxy-tetrahydrodipicolinate reductase [Spirochaetaceae bacterium]|jgi:4-hydroxy-tetrahydrodipicolinate reductase|nr:4-hydroxy-tetrahydrodipicolinate reductase [Spirochaetaceae bacterium]